MMNVIVALSLAGASLDRPPITCIVTNQRIVVRFYDHFRYSVPDKFAIVQARTLKGGEWLIVVNDAPPVRLSPYRPSVKQLIVDTRRQLAIDYSKGRGRIVHAFPKLGRYTLVFSDNLGTEPENMASWDCVVRVR